MMRPPVASLPGVSPPSAPTPRSHEVAGLVLARGEDDRPGLRSRTGAGPGGRSWPRAAAGLVIRSMVRAARPHLGVLLGNVPEYLFWLGAAALAGAIVVGINPTRGARRWPATSFATDCPVVVTDAEGAALLEGLDSVSHRTGSSASTTPGTPTVVADHRVPRPRWWPRRARGGPVSPALHLGDHGRSQGGAVHPGTAGLDRPGSAEAYGFNRETWPTAPCRSSTATP